MADRCEQYMKKIVVTGATSMIGVALIKECVLREMKVYAIVRPGSRKLGRLPMSEFIHIVECDLERMDDLPEIIKEKCDTFYHLGWGHTGLGRNDNLMYQVDNIAYTLQAVHVAQKLGCNKFIGAGSQAEYGCVDSGVIGPDTETNPVQAYGIAKYAAGRLAMLECSRNSMVCIWVRIFSVYGEDDKETTMISSAIDKMLQGEATAFTAGEQIWDYLYCGDAGRAMFLIGEKAEKSKVYCLGSGEGRKLKEYIKIIGEVVKPKQDLGIGKVPYSSTTIMHLCADIRTLTEDTGFKPETGFKEGIEKVYLDKKMKFSNQL